MTPLVSSVQRSLTCLFMLASACHQIASLCADEPPIPAEAHRGWERILQRPLPKRWYVRRIATDLEESEPKIVLNETRFFIASDTESFDRTLRWSIRHSQESISFKPDPATQQQRTIAAVVGNSRYTFALTRPTPELQWAVADAAPRATSPRVWMVRSMHCRPRSALLSIWTTDILPNALRATHCNIVSKGEIEFEGRRLYRIELDVGEPESATARYEPKIADGRHKLFLDPKQDWMVVREEYVHEPDNDLYVIERTVDPDTGLVAEEKDTIIALATGKATGETVRRFTYFFNDDWSPPDELFYLTGYGIPEPVELQSSSFSMWWLAVAGIVLVLFGIWLLRRSSHATAS